MYEPQPDEAEQRSFGFKPEDYANEIVEVWPENHEVFALFQFLTTQWRVGVGGVVGLDYTVMYHRMDRMALTSFAYANLESDIQVLEVAALKVLHAPKD